MVEDDFGVSSDMSSHKIFEQKITSLTSKLLPDI